LLAQIEDNGEFSSAETIVSLPSGTRLGHYEIIELIGAGGMGEVYRAHDPRLNRAVAVKVLLEHISEKPEASVRFEREARTIAGLHHPHICVVYDVGRHEKTDYLVMEFLEGETLASRLERGRLPLDQALQFAIEIAGALDKAHRSGVTHRDLKPGNIMITKNGVKLLDFGLAKLRDNGTVSSVSQAATKADVTAEGTIIGSLQYMAPEQLEGNDADARTDLFAFGATLHEMVTGQKAFEGKSPVSLMSAILKDTPKPISVLQPVAPESLERVITTCLAKDPDDRWQSARDLHRELKWVADRIANPAKGDSGITKSAPGWQTVPLTIAIIAILFTAAAVWMLKPGAPASQTDIVRLTVTLQPGEELLSAAGPPVALSPDGRVLAYASMRPGSSSQLYLRSMDNPEPKSVPGSEGAFNPFFSPNGQWVGFFAQGKLKKAPVNGGAVEALADASFGAGGTWSAEDYIYFAPTNIGGLWKVHASGGTPEEVSRLDRNAGEVSHRFPQILPAGKAVLFTVWTGPGWDETELHVLNLETKEKHLVVRGSRIGRFDSRSGHLVYFRQGTDTLMAVPFDLGRLQVTNDPPVTLAEHARDTSEAGELALSNSGTLAYIPSSPQWYTSRLVWVDRGGGNKPLAAPLLAYQEPVISPDGLRVAVSVAGPSFGIWIYDIARTTLTALTSNGSSQAPAWTPDGKSVVYRATRMGFRNIFQRTADGSGDETQLTMSESVHTPGTFSADGKQFIFTDSGISALSLDGDRTPKPLWKTSYREWNPHLSRDGRWLAYASGESGKAEIYVRPFPKLDGKWKISTDGGTEPVWSRDGRELFYRNNNRMMAVSIAAGDAFAAGLPQVLFEGRYQFSGTSVSGYDVSPDGKSFLMVQPAETVQPASQISIVLNWPAELNSPASTSK
jgi:serine/threonine-protein kinase